MKKKLDLSENYLDRKPKRHGAIDWQTEEDGLITLLIENTGFMNRLAQKLFKKPKVSFVHLDEMGSFIWPLLNGEKTIAELGEDVKTNFGEKANPLYERLIKYIQILDSYHFILWSE